MFFCCTPGFILKVCLSLLTRECYPSAAFVPMQSTPYTITLQARLEKKSVITNARTAHFVYEMPFATPVLMKLPDRTVIAARRYYGAGIRLEVYSVAAVKEVDLVMQVYEPSVFFLFNITGNAIYLFNKPRSMYVFKGKHCVPILAVAGRYTFTFRPGKSNCLLLATSAKLFEELGRKVYGSLPVPISSNMKKLLQQLQQAGGGDDITEGAIREIAEKMFVQYHVQAANTEKLAARGRNDIAERARDHLRAMVKTGNYKSFAEIADSLGTTPGKMARGFKKRFNLTLKRFVSEERMEMARTLLTEEGWLPAEVSSFLGYSRISSLFREYKRRWGQHPR